MKLQLFSVIVASTLLNTFALGHPDETLSGISLRSRGASGQPTIDQLMPFLELNSSIAWMDDGTGLGGRIAQIDDDAWDIATSQALAALQARGEIDIFHRALSGQSEVTDDSGKQHSESWVCRSGTGQAIVRGIAAENICQGIYAGMIFGATGKFVWTSNSEPDESGKLRRLVVSVSHIIAANGFNGACVALASQIAGEHGCGGGARLLHRQSGDAANAGGEVVVYANPDGGDKILVMEFGVPS